MDRWLLTAGAVPDSALATGELRLSELIGALSHALDITEGQPRGHGIRACWIGMQLGREIGLPDDALWALYYTLLLKDLGCSSNAARICELYLTDDLQFKREFKFVGDSLPQMLRFVFTHTGATSSLPRRVRAVLNILRNGPQIAQELIQTRCQRGADIARQLRFPASGSAGIHSLDEHWNGRGKPEGLAGDAIPVFARIALLAQVVDVFQVAAGPEAALAEAVERSGSWFDPALVQALHRVAARPSFWAALASPTLDQDVLNPEPGRHSVLLDDDYLDDIATAFGQVVDTKSPFTSGHSARVADYTDRIARQLGLTDARRRWLKRGALLHDVGKLGVSNAVLDKPGQLNTDEWAAVRSHAEHTEAILSRIGAFGELARVAAAHHERLDGQGYPRGLTADAISIETRIITTADIFDAISATRPYRAAVPVPQTLDIMARTVGSALDPLCFEALKQVVAQEYEPGPG
jgi:putative nucleotidyltransferase with HDIG domain